MSQIFVYSPASKEAHWILSLEIANKKNRIITCLNKLSRLYYQSRLGIVPSILMLYDIYTNIRHIEGYFDKEIARLTKLIKHKVKDKIEYESYNKQNYRLKVTNPIAASFYRLIHKYDTLNCLSETCVVLSIFKKRRLFNGKVNQYKQSIMRVITKLSQHKIEGITTMVDLTEEKKEALSIAIKSEVMPIFSKDNLRNLKILTLKRPPLTLTQKSEGANQ